jgi:hypothetical protein
MKAVDTETQVSLEQNRILQSLGLFLLPTGRPRRFFIVDIQAGGRPRRLP